jgi:hypothetical protein
MKFKRIISMVLSAVITVTSTAVFTGAPIIQYSIAVAADNNTTYSSWQEGYKETLKTVMSEGNYCSKAVYGESMCSTYAIRDLNNDGTPELFINYSPASAAFSELYTFYNSKVVKLMTLPRGGFVSYSPEKNLIYSSGGGGAGGYVYHTYSKINNGSIVNVDSFMISASTSPWKYYINEQEVTEEAYKSAKSNYDSIIWLTVEREKYFEDINSDDDLALNYNSWQEGYKDKLTSIVKEGNYCSKAVYGESMCSTYAIRDLNNDGIPELFINYQPVTAAYSELYTFYNSKVVKLMTLPRAGFVSYSPEKNLIYSSGGGGAGGYVYNTYSKIVNGSIENVDSFMVSGSTTPPTYYINEQKVSESTYKSEKTKYDNIIWLNVEREKYFENINSDFMAYTTTTTTTTKKTTTTTKATTTTTKKVTTTSKTTTTTTTRITTTTVPVKKINVTMWGDINCDGRVNVADVAAIRMMIVDMDAFLVDSGFVFNKAQARVNADVVDPQDITGISINPENVRITGADADQIIRYIISNDYNMTKAVTPIKTAGITTNTVTSSSATVTSKTIATTTIEQNNIKEYPASDISKYPQYINALKNNISSNMYKGIYNVSDVGYALYDINSDNIPELVISAGNYDIYSIYNDEVVNLTPFWGANLVKGVIIYENGCIGMTSISGNGEGGTTYYKYSGGKGLETIDSISFNTLKATYSHKGQSISREEYDKLISSYGQQLKISFTHINNISEFNKNAVDASDNVSTGKSHEQMYEEYNRLVDEYNALILEADRAYDEMAAATGDDAEVKKAKWEAILERADEVRREADDLHKKLQSDSIPAAS